MKIYIAHSSGFDFYKLLYEPIKLSGFWNKHTFILPHENTLDPSNSKKIISASDLVIAEVSYSSTGMGIELGWANANKIPVLCIYKKNAQISSSLSAVFKDFIEYDNATDMVEKLDNWFKLF